MTQEISSEPNDGQKPSDQAQDLKRAMHVDISSVISEYGIDKQIGMHADILAMHMIQSLDQLLMTLITQSRLSQQQKQGVQHE